MAGPSLAAGERSKWRPAQVYISKGCFTCGPFEELIYAGAQAYAACGKYNER